jgi:hypothetical protein
VLAQLAQADVRSLARQRAHVLEQIGVAVLAREADGVVVEPGGGDGGAPAAKGALPGVLQAERHLRGGERLLLAVAPLDLGDDVGRSLLPRRPAARRRRQPGYAAGAAQTAEVVDGLHQLVLAGLDETALADGYAATIEIEERLDHALLAPAPARRVLIVFARYASAGHEAPPPEWSASDFSGVSSGERFCILK